MHGVAADLDACAQPGELPGLLVDRDGEALLAQRRRGRKPAHAGARDGDAKGAFAHRDDDASIPAIVKRSPRSS
jgi:hypothetical protein